MTAISSRYFIAIVSLLIFLLTGQAGVQGYVLCLGEDGHAALEYAESSGCGGDDQERACREGLGDLQSQKDHCGPCLDVPASFDAASRRAQDPDFLAQASLPAVFQVFSLPSYLRGLTANLYPQPPPRVSQTILAHRTVVLLN